MHKTTPVLHKKALVIDAHGVMESETVVIQAQRSLEECRRDTQRKRNMPARYDAFLLRVWRDGPDEENRWAARLEHLPSGTIHRFTSLEALVSGLRPLLANRDDPRVAPPDHVSADASIRGEEDERS
jgi:hypothetical protein